MPIVELHIPTRIPVLFADSQFPSINKARIHCTSILRQNDEDGKLTAEHQRDIQDLMYSSESPYPIDGTTVKVSKRYFGRKCFVSEGPDKQHHYISIHLSLKRCVQSPKPDEGMK